MPIQLASMFAMFMESDFIFTQNQFMLLNRILVAITFLTVCGCSAPAKLYRDGRQAFGQLSNQRFDSLRTYLQGLQSRRLNDTLIIKYEFAHETCWDMLDQQNKEYIDGIINSQRKFINQQEEIRTGISVFHFKEKGTGFNKIVTLDSSIKTDDNLLRRWLFTEQTVCGTSAIVLPTGRYILIRSDSHFTALHETSKWTATIPK